MKKISAPSLLLIIMLVSFPQLSETIYVPSLPDIARSLNTSDNVVQFTLSIYFIGFAVGVLFWGALSDWIGRRPAMLWGIFIYGIGSLCCYLSSSIEFLLMSRFVQAFGASTGSVVTQTILRETIEGEKRHAVFAKVSAAVAFTPAIGPFLGGWLDQFFGFRLVFFSLVILAIVMYFSSFFGLSETRDKSVIKNVSVFSVLKRLGTDRKVIAYAFLIAGMNGFIFSYYAESPFIFIDFFQISPGIYGFLGIIVASASIVGSVLSRQMLSKYSAEKIIFFGCLIVLFGSIFLVGIAAIKAAPSILYMISILLGVFILFVGIGMTIPNCLSLALATYQDVIGTASALFGMGYYFLISFFTWGMSYLHNDSLLTMPLYFFTMSLVMVMICRKFVTVK